MALLPCGLPPCPEHALCAFHGDEPDRCPWCHRSWAVIITTGWHSCERNPRIPDPVERRERIAEARGMRRMAARRPQDSRSGQQSLHCQHRARDIGRVRYLPQVTA